MDKIGFNKVNFEEIKNRAKQDIKDTLGTPKKVKKLSNATTGYSNSVLEQPSELEIMLSGGSLGSDGLSDKSRKELKKLSNATDEFIKLKPSNFNTTAAAKVLNALTSVTMFCRKDKINKEEQQVMDKLVKFVNQDKSKVDRLKDKGLYKGYCNID